MDFSRLVAEHGYLITFFSALIEGETILTLGGLAAHRGYLHLPLLIVLAATGSFLGDQIYFLIGRRFGKRLIAQFPRFKPAIRRVDALVLRYAGISVVAIRFLYGLRTVGPITIGASRMPWHTFALFNAVGAVAWSATWLMGGYLMGGSCTCSSATCGTSKCGCLPPWRRRPWLSAPICTSGTGHPFARVESIPDLVRPKWCDSEYGALF